MTLISTAAKGGAASSNLVKIADTALAADAASIDITAIPAAYLHLMIVAQFRSTVAAVGDFLLLKVNGDGGANYYDQTLDANAAVVSSGQDVAQTRGFTQGCVGDTAPTGAFTAYSALIPMYAGTNTKTFIDQAGEVRALAGNFHYNGVAGMWNSSAAITRLTFTMFTGPNLKAGSRVTVYGLAAN